MTSEGPKPDGNSRREIVVGRNSRVWRAISGHEALRQRFTVALTHTEVPTFPFTLNDRVWVFAYSRNADENLALLQHLRRLGVASTIYVSSASVVVNRLTRCYQYPRVKLAAEEAARQLLGAQILTLGLVHAQPDELPAGANIATTHKQIVEFLLAPSWTGAGGTSAQVFSIVQRPFANGLERGLYSVYGAMLFAVRRFPCLLRPLDALLRAMGMRWYGYLYLSNQLWISTTS